jgi:hypothetical protein
MVYSRYIYIYIYIYIIFLITNRAQVTCLHTGCTTETPKAYIKLASSCDFAAALPRFAAAPPQASEAHSAALLRGQCKPSGKKREDGPNDGNEADDMDIGRP